MFTRSHLVLCFWACAPAWAAGLDALVPSGPAPLLEQIRAANQSFHSDLQSFVCDERVERFRGKLNTNEARHIDTLTAQVSYENGLEHYVDVRQDERPLASFSDLSGAWSEGEFGTLLKQTAELISGVQPGAGRASFWNGQPATLLSLEVPASTSPWQLVLEDGRTQSVAFHVLVWIDKASGKIIRVLRQSSELPRELGISQLEWSVTLKLASVRDSKWLVPQSAEYSVSYAGLNRRESNRIFFSNYRRYGSQASVSYGD